MKHGLWLQLLERVVLTCPQTVEVIDTHAGAGLYDLSGPMPQKSGEYRGGLDRLMAASDPPPALEALRQHVRAINAPNSLRQYPGSPLLSLEALRAQDRYRGWELRQEDQTALQALVERRPRGGAAATILLGDGYQDLRRTGDRAVRRVVLIDPPFERGDEAVQIVSGVEHTLQGSSDPTIAVWTPIKDLETFDSLLRALEALRPRSLIAAEVRLRPLTNPMKLNGSALIILNGPEMLREADELCAWVAAACGEAGRLGRARQL